MRIPYTIKNYWINVGASFLVASISNLILGLLLGSELARFVFIVLLIYWIAIEIRRLHDANKSGWFALFNLIPGIGTFTALVFAGVLKSNYENNKWYQGTDK